MTFLNINLLVPKRLFTHVQWNLSKRTPLPELRKRDTFSYSPPTTVFVYISLSNIRTLSNQDTFFCLTGARIRGVPRFFNSLHVQAIEYHSMHHSIPSVQSTCATFLVINFGCGCEKKLCCTSISISIFTFTSLSRYNY